MLEYVSLPEEYKFIIQEKKPPKPKNRWSGRPFWASEETYSVYFENDKFVYYKPNDSCHNDDCEPIPDDEVKPPNTNTLESIGCFIEPTPDTKEKEYIPIEVGMKGFFCIACEPGSGPQPFIIVDIDNTKERIGIICPYVYIVSETDDDVELKVGCDMSQYAPEGCCERFEPYDVNAVKIISEKYKVFYRYRKDIIGKYWLGVDVGSFGNHGLPKTNEKGHAYEYIQ